MEIPIRWSENTGLQGAKALKLRASMVVLQESLAQGGWTKRGRVKADAGFYQGLEQRLSAASYRDSTWRLSYCLAFGRPVATAWKKTFASDLKKLRGCVDARGNSLLRRYTDEQIENWVKLCRWKEFVYTELDSARQKPVLTKIGLSPKVTKTLTEMNLDLDLTTLRVPYVYRKIRNPKTGRMETVVEVVWSKGCQHARSRFAGGGPHCEACGKRIPSMMFVPLEFTDRKTGKPHSLWLGCDCANNIGVKDLGVKKS